MEHYTRNNLAMFTLIFISTIAIIFTNYIFSKGVSIQVYDRIMDIEYKKIGGKDNYDILKEVQKEQILSYINRLKEEDPEKVRILQRRAELAELGGVNVLSQIELYSLKKDSYIKGKQVSDVTVIEFSDMECSYCRDFHNNGVMNSVLESYKDDVNYIYKNFPLPNHKDAYTYALTSKCVENMLNGETYLKFVNDVFFGSGKTDLYSLIKDKGIEKEEFDNCISGDFYKKNVEREFMEGRKLGINATPSSVIIYNPTGEYIVLSGAISKEQLETNISKFVGNKSGEEEK